MMCVFVHVDSGVLYSGHLNEHNYQTHTCTQDVTPCDLCAHLSLLPSVSMFNSVYS